MEFKEDIQKRRTTFQFTGTPVTAEQIKWIIRAGITAPSFDHKRKWNLIAVTSEMAKRKVTDYIDPCLLYTSSGKILNILLCL